jgi:hypothetical protein
VKEGAGEALDGRPNHPYEEEELKSNHSRSSSPLRKDGKKGEAWRLREDGVATTGGQWLGGMPTEVGEVGGEGGVGAILYYLLYSASHLPLVEEHVKWMVWRFDGLFK